ncbi:hypothetical protein GI582_02625 [Sulfitobacter sp. BDSS02]|nr:hypothetical protein [Sulfitobacter sp. BDSS02]MBR9847760.1 hypothetical protein [Paracoccaceae bacterium]
MQSKDPGFGLTVEIKLIDSNGSGHCIAYGPALATGDAEAAAERFAGDGPLMQMQMADPGSTLTRRYSATGLPFTAELLSYGADGVGPVVGLVFAGVDPASVSALGGSAAPQQNQDASPEGMTERDIYATALRLCIQPGMQPQMRADMFRQSGFRETSSDYAGNGDTTLMFSSPEGSIEVELYYGNMPEHCLATSSLIGVNEASAILDQVVPQIYPGYVRQVQYGVDNPDTGKTPTCARYEDPTTPIGDVIGVIAGDDSHRCSEDGSSRFYQSSRV